MSKDMEARRVVCHRGHTIAVLKTEPGQAGDDFAATIVGQYGCCIFCGEKMIGVEREALSVFEGWSSREDGRYGG